MTDEPAETIQCHRCGQFCGDGWAGEGSPPIKKGYVDFEPGHRPAEGEDGDPWYLTTYCEERCAKLAHAEHSRGNTNEPIGG